MPGRPASRTDLLNSLTPYSITLLTTLLTLSPDLAPTSTYYHTRQSTQISKLPSPLLRRCGLLPSLKKHLHLNRKEAHLCSTHHDLDPNLIHCMFNQVQAEVNEHIWRFQYAPPTYTLPSNVKAFMERVRSINGLWMSAEAFATRFGEKWKFAQIENECEACMLSFVGRNAGILSDLRASMIGRRKKHGPWPRMMRFVDAWIELADGTQAGPLMIGSEKLGREVREVRKRMRVEREQMSRDEGGDDEVHQRGRGEKRGTSKGRRNSTEVKLFPYRTTVNQFSDSLQYDPPSGIFVPKGGVPAAQPAYQARDLDITGEERERRPSSRFSDSVYSQDDEIPYEKFNSLGAGTDAADYQALLDRRPY